MDNQWQDPVVQLEKVSKRYRHDAPDVLRGVSLALRPGTLNFVCGPSGVGKSTLLHIVGLMDRPTSGEVYFLGTPVSRVSPDATCRLRIATVGFMFQFHYLLENLTVRENILLPRWMKEGVVDHDFRGDSLVPSLGLKALVDRYPYELSGGEQQRTALARALINKPRLLIADEPTGNLDHRNGLALIDLVRRSVRECGVTALVATHNRELITAGDTVIEMQDGAIRDMTCATPHEIPLG